MNTKILGVISIIVGIALCVWGYDVYESASAALDRIISGNTPIEAWLGIVGGAILIVFGIFRVK
ncbi:MAG: heme/copper-type cytochrome/quinol oxidase subunit 2 [Kangiellaceae bacterium]|jgi:heme/copper-type cytochrome/quinol oxidase subunit 2